MTTPTLRQGVGLTGVVMLGAGTAIGVSIFSVLQPAAAVAGSGLLVAIAIAAVPMIFFAATYAWLASAVPVSGASYEWPRRFLSPFVGFAIAWLRILGNVGAMVILSRVLVNYLAMAFQFPATPVLALAITLVFALNLVGVQLAAGAQIVLMTVLILVLGLFVGTGLTAASPGVIGDVFAPGWLAILEAVPLLITLFLGIESAVEIGEEVRDARRTIPLGILLAILLTTVVYAAVAATALAVLGPKALATSMAPLLDAARVPLGAVALPIIVGAATISILKAMNANAMVFSRSLFAMARAGAMPAALAAVHPRFGTPHRAILLCYALVMLGLFLPNDLVFLLLAVNIPTMLKYLACSLCAIRVARENGPVARGAGLGFAPRTVVVLGWAGVVSAVAIIIAGLGADYRAHVLTAAWFAVGAVFYAVRNRRRDSALSM